MLNVFVRDLDDASEYTAGHIADDTKLEWGMTKGKSFSAEGPGKSSEFGQRKPHKDEQSEAQSSVLEWKNPVPWYRPATHWLRNRQPCWKGLGVTRNARLNMSCQCPLFMNKTNHRVSYVKHLCSFLLRLCLKLCI